MTQGEKKVGVIIMFDKVQVFLDVRLRSLHFFKLAGAIV